MRGIQEAMTRSLHITSTSPSSPSHPSHPLLSRREMLRKSGMGFGSLALASLMRNSAPAAGISHDEVALRPLASRQPHFPAKAKHIIHLFMNGGPSHVDTFDPKPTLDKYNGKEIPNKLPTERKTG